MSKNEIFLDNIRAKFALEKIQKSLEKLKDKEKKGYRSRAREFPTMISQDLLQTIVFYFSKRDKSAEGYEAFLNDIIGWFHYIKKENNTDFELNYSEDDILLFIKCLQELDTFKYLLITEELIKVGIWFKLFATALIKQDKEG